MSEYNGMFDSQCEISKYKGKNVCFISKGIDCTIEGELVDVIGFLAKVKTGYGFDYANLLTFQRFQVRLNN